MQSTSSRTKMKTINGDSLTPILIFRRLQGQYKFLLESSAQHEGAGRYSFIGANPRKTYKGMGNEIQEYVYKTDSTYTHKGDLLALLKQMMPRISNTTQIPFSGGAVGYVNHLAQGIAHDSGQLPNIHFHIYETIIVFDHLTDEVTMIYTNIDAEKKEPDLEALAAQLLKGDNSAEPTWSYQPLHVGKKEPFDDVLKAEKAALHGEATRIIVSNRFIAGFQGEPFALYRQLRKKNPSSYMYYVEFEEYTVIGTAPSSLIRVKGERVIATPTEGAFPRGTQRSEDVINERKLYENVEIRNSHTVSVSAIQQELQSVCFRDSIQVIEAMKIERSKQLLYMTSRVEGKLLPMLHALDVLASVLPPFNQADPLIEGIGGAIGFVGFNGHLDFALTGQSIVIDKETMHLQSAITMTKHTNIQRILKQMAEHEARFKQIFEK
ncbi:chorismate-binding protein [Lysinibacillus piscis]|uniref:Anthranilate synthase component 1 n=1 Tax=Lysinibacillus piscis TaxID=2518931 RepID=A0ABQ5NJL0_9BACI|nr:chorismate-binding protein [Lysinibacillus sp. KH24]GLC88460.1 anthranilate synthase component I [Lysinibacillus sp. KH24]